MHDNTKPTKAHFHFPACAAGATWTRTCKAASYCVTGADGLTTWKPSSGRRVVTGRCSLLAIDSRLLDLELLRYGMLCGESA